MHTHPATIPTPPRAPALDPAAPMPTDDLSWARALLRFQRKSDCALCADEPYASGFAGGRCPYHRAEWPAITDDLDTPPHPTDGNAPGWWLTLDAAETDYALREGRLP